MTMEEFNSSLTEIMQKEYENAKMTNANHLLPEPKPVMADWNMQVYLRTMAGYVEASALSRIQRANIPKKFPSQNQYGALIGFIDTGLLLMAKKGMCGIAFCTSGLCERSLTEKTDTGVSYITLCQSILKDKKNNLLSENKFLCRQDRLTVIESTGKMFARLQEIRTCLLANNPEARSAYCRCYQILLDKVWQSYQDGQLAEAKVWFQTLSEYVYGNLANGYVVPKQMLIILNMVEYNFQVAKAIADQMGDASWKSLVSEKELQYRQIVNQQYYDEAEKFYQNGQYSEALSAIRNALNALSTMDSWQLYIDLICEVAKEVTDFPVEDFKRLTSEEKTPEQAEVVAKNFERINEINQHYQEFIAYIHESIPEKAMQNDIEFFKKYLDLIVDYTDEYDMNAIMYAALFHNKDLYCFLETTSIDKTQKNVLSFGCDLLFACTDVFGNVIEEITTKIMTTAFDSLEKSNLKYIPSKELELFEKLSVYLGEGLENFQNEYAEAKVHTAKLEASVVKNTALYKMALNNGEAQSAAKYKELIEDAAREIITPEELDQRLEDAIIKLTTETLTAGIFSAWLALTYYMIISPNVPEIAPDAGIEEYLKISEYNKVYDEEKENFITDYLEKNLSPKGEFETTAQFEVRKEDIKNSAENMFLEKGLEILQEYHEEKKEKVQHHRKCAECAKKIVSLLWQAKDKTLTLGAYHADEQYFDFTWKGYSYAYAFQSRLQIPLEYASKFKETYAEGVSFKIQSVDLQEGKAQCTVSFENVDYNLALELRNCVYNVKTAKKLVNSLANPLNWQNWQMILFNTGSELLFPEFVRGQLHVLSKELAD